MVAMASDAVSGKPDKDVGVTVIDAVVIALGLLISPHLSVDSFCVF